MKVLYRMVVLVATSLLTAVPLHGQTFGGQTVDSRSGEPLVNLPVRLLQHREGLPVPAIVDSTRTDERGLFAFRVVAGGVYQAEFGPWGTPYSLGTIDTVRQDRLLRRYVVPVPQAPLPQPQPGLDTAGRSGPPGSAIPGSMAPKPSLVRTALMTAAGAALGAAAGYVVADLRCGRIRGCSPVTSYPYYAGGATLGASFGSGLSDAVAGCTLGFARGLVGSVLGSLAGSLIAGEGASRAHAGAALGAPIGGMLLVSTCRIGRLR